MALKSSTSTSTIFSVLPKPTSRKSTPSISHPRLFKPIRIQSLRTRSPDSPNPSSRNPSSSSSSVATFLPRAVASTPTPPTSSELAASKLRRLVIEFQSLTEPLDRVKRLLHYAALLPEFPPSSKVDANRVMGCTAQVWLTAELDEEGRVRFRADSDSEITRGFCSCLIRVLDGALPEDVLEMKTDDLGALSVVGLAGNVSSRVNTWHNVLVSMQKKCRAFIAQRDGRPKLEPFPSLVVTAEGISAQGAYAEAQVGVYRMSNERIGCSLADAAAAPSYLDYLRTASTSSPSLHVVYINTSLETKAHAHELVPTITCTSSNVVQTILQAFAQVPNLNVWYGPDTYMGANIVELFQQMLMMTDEEITQIHPGHSKKSIRSLLPRLHYFP